MVGYSLVNINQDSSYGSFFEKSSLLLGAGYRINNVLRLTTGVQCLYKLGKDVNKNATKEMIAMPFVGLSFDLNVKQYLNGAVDLFSGISKTKAPTIATKTSSN